MPRSTCGLPAQCLMLLVLVLVLVLWLRQDSHTHTYHTTHSSVASAKIFLHGLSKTGTYLKLSLFPLAPSQMPDTWSNTLCGICSWKILFSCHAQRISCLLSSLRSSFYNSARFAIYTRLYRNLIPQHFTFFLFASYFLHMQLYFFPLAKDIHSTFSAFAFDFRHLLGPTFTLHFMGFSSDASPSLGFVFVLWVSSVLSTLRDNFKLLI